MSARKGFAVKVQRDADGGQPPNRKVPFITVEVRAFWPDTVTLDEVLSALDAAHDEAADEAIVRMRILGAES
jgi:hypothetical protein